MTATKFADLRSIAELAAFSPDAAADGVREYLRKRPLDADAYRLLNQILDGLGQRARSAPSSGIVLAPALRAERALAGGDLETAEIILRGHLKADPGDALALELLADLASRLSFEPEAEALLRFADELAPASSRRALALAASLYRQNRPDEAVVILDGLLSSSADDIAAQNLRAAALARLGRGEEAASAYERALALQPEQPATWSRYGQLLRTLGRLDDSVAALRRAIHQAPQDGELWWGLSDLKTVPLTAADVAQMETALAGAGPRSRDAMFLHFALGKALEDHKRFEEAFHHYSRGNAIIKSGTDYDPDEVSQFVEASAGIFTQEFFDDRAGCGEHSAAPIFILGMPRAGSTLLEQMLGAHTEIEATMELPEMIELGEHLACELPRLPAAIANCSADELRTIGRQYLERTQRYRRTDCRFFIDKMPNNWIYAPLIHLALPDARIIDMRREPLDCAVSNYKQLFTARQGFSTDLEWMGRYYGDYVQFMRHIDAVLPGRVQRLIYEDLIDGPEKSVSRLLAELGLAFEPTCTAPDQYASIVRTASADQVRRPINRSGIGSWRRFEPWLEPLRQGLGDTLRSYR